MSLIAASALAALAAYLLGSIPTGFLVARAKGVDIRAVGSGNIGATNVMRIVGRPAGVFVLLADALKGCGAVWLLPRLPVDRPLAPDALGGAHEILAVVAGLSAILGHNYTCWLGFKGGKGVATTAGVVLALAPWALFVVLGLWIVLLWLTRFVSVGSVGAAAALPFATWFTTQHPLLTAVTVVMGALAIHKHKPNLQRLIRGTEPRFGAPKPTDPKSPAP